jgi:hypothetical protein
LTNVPFIAYNIERVVVKSRFISGAGDSFCFLPPAVAAAPSVGTAVPFTFLARFATLGPSAVARWRF